MIAKDAVKLILLVGASNPGITPIILLTNITKAKEPINGI
jgi:hypothetical protein